MKINANFSHYTLHSINYGISHICAHGHYMYIQVFDLAAQCTTHASIIVVCTKYCVYMSLCPCIQHMLIMHWWCTYLLP